MSIHDEIEWKEHQLEGHCCEITFDLDVGLTTEVWVYFDGDVEFTTLELDDPCYIKIDDLEVIARRAKSWIKHKQIRMVMELEKE